MAENGPSQAERLPTGVPGLDTLMRGGFIKGGVYMVLGMPGAGKTILGNQVCFHHTSTGGRALYVTLLAETHTRMISNLRSMKFFELSRIPDSLAYLSAYSVLEEGGLDALLELIRKEIKSHRATLLILDGLVAAEEIAPTERDFKKFIHGIQVTTGLMGCTSLLLTTGGGSGLKAEHTMVDGMLILRERTFGVRAVRELTVRKFRGSGHLRGPHSFDISDRGITVFPRLETVVETEVPASSAKERMAFGIKGLDAMLHGGIFVGSTLMLFGTPGSGKTLLGLHFLAEGARKGERGHYFAFYDAPQRVRDQATSVGLALEPLMEKGTLELSFRPPLENLLDELGTQLLHLIREKGIRRLFVDGFEALQRTVVHKPRIARFMAALVNECRSRGVTLLFSVETEFAFGPQLKFPVRGISMITENILFLRCTEVGSELRRFISVLKLRTSEHDPALREFQISRKGLSVGDPISNAQLLMSGLAQISPTQGASRKRRFKLRGK
ncbi:ATPase domain-containing protein [Hyalangium rubrum]|uniref:non-specific serine/threonine protein kinase n=1 Tax=Hyalangium rubrum TaxID=3103134 RepID=A0ABU5HC27_9BACT|nr:ATPase domain-containing protein [Hyalangium sp. s54d21]MDY7231004.1 ATPase domain-containing protein [Hyalangium sp. s54d21]